MYLRKSRSDISRTDLDGDTQSDNEILLRHERHLLDVAFRMGIHIPESAIFREVVSGETIEDRPVIQTVIQQVEDGEWAGVFVMEVERLARGDTSDQGLIASTFKYSGTKIITPTKTYDPNNEFDEEYFEFGLFMSRREYKMINRRQQRGRRDAVREGKYPFNAAPYGYVRVKLQGEKGWTLEPHPEQAPIVKLIFDMYVNQGMGSGLISNHLDQSGVPTANNSVWEVQTITGIIRNPIYYGVVAMGRRPETKIRSKGVTTKTRPRAAEDTWIVGNGRHEPLVSKELWDRAQEILSSKYHPPAPKGVITSSLAGIVKCELCGKTLVRRPYTNNQNASLICITRGCKNISSAFDLVEARILKGLRSWIDEYKAQWDDSSMDEIRNNDQSLITARQSIVNSTQKELDKLKSQASNLDDLLEQGIYSREKYMERAKLLTDRLKDAEVALAAANGELNLEMERQRAKVEIIPKVEHVLEVYSHTEDIGEKNALLKSVIEMCSYKKTVRGHWTKPDSLEMFDIVIFPKIPSHF